MYKCVLQLKMAMSKTSMSKMLALILQLSKMSKVYMFAGHLQCNRYSYILWGGARIKLTPRFKIAVLTQSSLT